MGDVINSEKECQRAANNFRIADKNTAAAYSTLKQNRNDLPKGCIFDEMIPLQPHVYWNPNGTENVERTQARFRARSVYKMYRNLPYKKHSIRKYTSHIAGIFRL